MRKFWKAEIFQSHKRHLSQRHEQGICLLWILWWKSFWKSNKSTKLIGNQRQEAEGVASKWRTAEKCKHINAQGSSRWQVTSNTPTLHNSKSSSSVFEYANCWRSFRSKRSWKGKTRRSIGVQSIWRHYKRWDTATEHKQSSRSPRKYSSWSCDCKLCPQ